MYEFDNQTLVFGYDNNNQLIGMFVLYEGNQLTKSEMFDIFDNQVDFMMTVPIKEKKLPGITRDSSDEEIESATSEIMEICSDIYNRAIDLNLNDSECQYQIAKIVH